MQSFEEAVQYLNNCGLVATIDDPYLSVKMADEVISGGTINYEREELENWYYILRESGQIKFRYYGEIHKTFSVVCDDLAQACRFACELLLGNNPVSENTQLSEKSQERLKALKLHTLRVGLKESFIMGGRGDIDLFQLKRILAGYIVNEEDERLSKNFGHIFYIRCWKNILIGEIFKGHYPRDIIIYSNNLDSVINAICRYYKIGELPDEPEIDI